MVISGLRYNGLRFFLLGHNREVSELELLYKANILKRIFSTLSEKTISKITLDKAKDLEKDIHDSPFKK